MAKNSLISPISTLAEGKSDESDESETGKMGEKGGRVAPNGIARLSKAKGSFLPVSQVGIGIGTETFGITGRMVGIGTPIIGFTRDLIGSEWQTAMKKPLQVGHDVSCPYHTIPIEISLAEK